MVRECANFQICMASESETDGETINANATLEMTQKYEYLLKRMQFKLKAENTQQYKWICTEKHGARCFLLYCLPNAQSVE